MRPWVIELEVDRGIYRIDLRRHTYRFVRRNPAWDRVPPERNARNKRQLHGLTRVFRDGTTKVFLDRTWPYDEEHPCPTCHSWVPRDSPCDHEKYECPTCGRRQCLRHWPYPMRSRREAVHFLKSAQLATGKECFIRPIERSRGRGPAVVWKIFTSEDDYESYVATGRHRR